MSSETTIMWKVWGLTKMYTVFHREIVANASLNDQVWFARRWVDWRECSFQGELSKKGKKHYFNAHLELLTTDEKWNKKVWHTYFLVKSERKTSKGLLLSWWIASRLTWTSRQSAFISELRRYSSSFVSVKEICALATIIQILPRVANIKL